MRIIGKNKMQKENIKSYKKRSIFTLATVVTLYNNTKNFKDVNL